MTYIEIVFRQFFCKKLYFKQKWKSLSALLYRSIHLWQYASQTLDCEELKVRKLCQNDAKKASEILNVYQSNSFLKLVKGLFFNYSLKNVGFNEIEKRKKIDSLGTQVYIAKRKNWHTFGHWVYRVKNKKNDIHLGVYIHSDVYIYVPDIHMYIYKGNTYEYQGHKWETRKMLLVSVRSIYAILAELTGIYNKFT